MTSIYIPRDDTGIIDTKIKNANSPSIRAPSAVPETIKGTKVSRRTNPKYGKQFARERRKVDRRKQERRHSRSNVLLDTRSNRERRRGDRRVENKQSSKKVARHNKQTLGIDDYG